MKTNPRITRLTGPDPSTEQQLAQVLIDCVDGGASVSFMWPLPQDQAAAFWQRVLSGAAAGERIVLAAQDEQGIVGTVQVLLAQPDNQPHRADIAKMLVHRRGRRQGIGEALMRAAEQAALQAGKTLLVLDTVTDSDASRLYARLGWQMAGHIPAYALWPRGGYCSTTYYYKALAPMATAPAPAPAG